MDEEHRWGWMAVLLGACALLTAAACALASVWVAGGLFAAIGLGMLDVGWIRLHSRR